MDHSEPLRAIPSSPQPPAPVTLAQAVRYWFRLGFISFGGPAGQIALMHRDLVEDRRWISEKRFLHALNYCMLLPGPEAQQLATYIGWLMHRTWGGVLAGVLFVLPSLFILIALSWVYLAFGNTTLVSGLFFGIKPAVVALVIQAVHRIASRTLRNGWMWAIAISAFIAIFALKLPFPLIVAMAALTGWIGRRLAPQSFRHGSGGHGTSASPHVPALMDDSAPTPPHAQFRWARLISVLIAGALLWLVPMGLLTFGWGWTHPFTQMGWFFTKAALLTFGGAYAVLPYVYQGAVIHHGWLTSQQMIDGLALGETTPGPLIMVVAFVGFVGGYTQTLLGPQAPFLAGVLAATLVTWFTFLPSFLFILAGGPLVESTHDNLKFTAPLTAITAAVVGVVLNLALFFAWHTWWPQGSDGPFDLIAAGISVLATVALLRFKRQAIEVIAVCALLGLLTQILR